MANRYDENSVIRSLRKIARVDSVEKVVYLNRKNTIGIRLWGKIDYLTNILGYHIVSDNTAGNKHYNKREDDNKETKRQLKKERKAPKLQDKRKKK